MSTLIPYTPHVRSLTLIEVVTGEQAVAEGHDQLLVFGDGRCLRQYGDVRLGPTAILFRRRRRTADDQLDKQQRRPIYPSSAYQGLSHLHARTGRYRRSEEHKYELQSLMRNSSA